MKTELDVSDEQLFEALDLDFPGLEKVKQHYGGGRMEAAKGELVSYYGRRQQPAWFFDCRGGAAASIDLDRNRFVFGGSSVADDAFIEDLMKDANLLLNNQFRGAVVVELGSNLDRFPFYDALETERKGDTEKPRRVTANRFTRMNFMSSLAAAYQLTKDRRYGIKLGQLLQAFFDDYAKTYPYAHDPIEDKEAYWFYYQKTPIRTNMCVSQSIINFMNVLNTSLFDSEFMPATLSFRMLKFFWYLMDYHRNYDSRRYRPFNHHLFENGVVPFMIGVMFPEFPSFRPMLERGKDVIRQHVLADFHPSGGYDEHSLHYTCDTTVSTMLVAAQALAERNGIALFDAAGREAMNRTFDFYSGLVLPDKTFPDIGDNGGGHAAKFLAYGSDHFGNRSASALLRLFAQGPAYSAGPDATSDLPALHVHDPLAGYTCARDKWAFDSSGFVMSNKTFTKECGHNHLDMLSLTFWSNGETIIGEPLAADLYKYVGNHTSHDHHVRGTGSHNTVQIGGESLARKQLFEQKRNEAQSVQVKRFSTSGGSVYVSAFHDAYVSHRHTRNLLFVHEAGSLIVDVMDSDDGCAQPHIQRWHMEHHVKIEPISRTSVLLTGNSGKLLCVWPDTANVSLRPWQDTAVLDIRHFHKYANAGELPWILDVAFKGEPGERSAYLPCLFVNAAHLNRLPVEACAELMLSKLADKEIDTEKDAFALRSLAEHG